jgi:hypothetical protein
MPEGDRRSSVSLTLTGSKLPSKPLASSFSGFNARGDSYRPKWATELPRRQNPEHS